MWWLWFLAVTNAKFFEKEKIEVGVIDKINHEELTVDLKKSFEEPIVFLGPSGFRGTSSLRSHMAIGRLAEVKKKKFTAWIDEPASCGEGHHLHERMDYIVLEQGAHSPGYEWITASATIKSTNRADYKEVKFDIPFNGEYKDKIVVIVQIQTQNSRQYVNARA